MDYSPPPDPNNPRARCWMPGQPPFQPPYQPPIQPPIQPPDSPWVPGYPSAPQPPDSQWTPGYPPQHEWGPHYPPGGPHHGGHGGHGGHWGHGGSTHWGPGCYPPNPPSGPPYERPWPSYPAGSMPFPEPRGYGDPPPP